MNYARPELRTRLANEYVLGTLIGAARRRMERLLLEDDAYRQAVLHSSRLNNLVELLPPVTPPPELWLKIRKRILGRAAISEVSKRAGAVWRGWAIAASILLASLTAYTVLTPKTTTQQVTYVVVLTNDASSTASWVIGTDPASGQLRVKALAPQPLPSERVFQLWMKVRDEATVRPVGLIPADGQANLKLPENIVQLLSRTELFGVSVEPPGGSPTGLPTTTPLYHGKVINL